MLKIFDTYVKFGEKLIKWKVYCQPDKKMNIYKRLIIIFPREFSNKCLKVITIVIGKTDCIDRF